MFYNIRKGGEKVKNWNCSKAIEYLDACAREKGVDSSAMLSDLSGVDQATISRIRTGKSKNPSIYAMLDLFDSVDASIDAAFGLRSADELAERCELTHKLEIAESELESKERLLTNREEQVHILRQELARHRKIILIQAIVLAVLLALILAVLIYDKLNPNVGWFRDSTNSLNSAALEALWLFRK